MTKGEGRQTAEYLEQGTCLFALQHGEDAKFWNVYATKRVRE